MTFNLPSLRKGNSPQASAGKDFRYSLDIRWYPQTNFMSELKGDPGWIISDGLGYLTCTRDFQEIGRLVQLESQGGFGTVRELLTGEPQVQVYEEPGRMDLTDPSPLISLTDLNLDL